jgi:hypothetical protein
MNTFLYWALSLALSAPQAAPAPPDGEQAKKVEALVRDLGSDDAATRDKADRKLRKIGKPAEDALRRASESADPEVKSRARAILEWLKVLKLDEQGRVQVERDDKGWHVEYSRDPERFVIKKSWVNPFDGRAEYVRSYVYEARDRRLVIETDAGGCYKRTNYAPSGAVTATQVDEGFVEERDQVAKMPSPKKPELDAPGR